MENQVKAANCGLFWVANSIISTIMGAKNRELQEESTLRNQDFQRELEEARIIAQNEIEAEKIAFQRRKMKLARQYRQVENTKVFEQQLQSIELQSFISNYWPLSKALPNIFLNEIEEIKKDSKPLPMNIVLLHAPLLPPRRALAGEMAHKDDISIYRDMEQYLETKLKVLGDVKLRRDACTNTDFVGGNANMMNIHFLMGALPTLVISPKLDNAGKMLFNTAVWEAQAVRPLIRPLFSIDYNPQMAEKESKYLEDAIDNINTALSIIIGTTRDSYMLLTQRKAPMLGTLLDDKQKALIKSNRVLKDFVRNEYNNIVNTLNLTHTPKLLEAYSETDVKHMKQLAQKMSVTF